SIDQSGTRIVISATNSQGTVTQSFKIFVAEAPDCPSGINNMYKLNDLSAPYVDFSGGNDGEALNPPTPVAGKFGGAMQFDGVNDGINLPNDGYDFAASSSFSMEFWVKTPGSTSNKVCIGRQGTFGDTDTSDLHMWVGVQANTGAVIFYLRDSWGFEPPTTGLLTGGDVNDNQWHYVVAVRDGVSKKTYLYVDGSEVAVSEAYDYPHSFGSFPEDPMNIGFLYRQNGTPDYFFNGAMDEVAIYTKALSATEVSNNYVKSFTGKWHCAPGNYAPGFVTDPVTDVTEDALYTYDIETMDIDQDDVLSLTVSEKPDWLTFTNLGNGMGTLSGTPQDEDIGDHNVVLSVTDTKSTVDQEFTIHVANQSDAPVITSTPLTTIDEDTPYSYTIVASDPDAGDVITYSATTLPSWLTFNPATHVLSGIPENEDVGDHQVVLLVTDGTNPVEQPFTITVVNVNDPPSISGQNTKVTNEDVSFTITLADLTVVDVDNDPADLTLHVEAGLNYTFTGNTITPAQDYNGMLVVNVHVNDLQGSSSSFGVEVTVAPVNDAPVITSEPIRTAIINKLYGFVLSATDVDGDNLVKSAVSIPAFLNFDPGTGILGGTPAASDYGEHIVALKVSDGTVEVPVNFTLTVSYDVGVENQSVIKRVYPVPASEYLIIEYGIEQDGTIMVIDLAGKHLIEEHVSSSDEMIRLDVTGLEEGMYM
ncbi:MAG: hypothetical protein EHM46_03375, partial [Bacteroidetes bacterium]